MFVWVGAATLAYTVYSGERGARAAKKAGQIQAESADKASQIQWDMYTQSRQDQMPWLEAGKRGLEGLEREMEAGPGEFVPEDQPGYKFGFEEFIKKPYESSMSARGKRLSGEKMKGLTKYAQDYASTTYDNFLQRYYQRLTPYQSVANVGQTTGRTMGGQSMQQGQLQGEIAMGKANVLAEAGINAQNARTQAGQSVSDTLGTWGGWVFG